MNHYVYVLDHTGNPLMPTKRHGWVRRALRDGKASVVKRSPFTIKLTYESETVKQDVSLHLDAGYANIGFSAQSESRELLGGEVKLLKGMSERIKERAMYRNNRRSNLRYRKPKFKKGGDFISNRPDGWLAPSIQHKLDSHLHLSRKIQQILPITSIQIETASFDIQKINNPNIEGAGYQQGEQFGFWNLREYILHRDNHTCQNPNCKNKSKEKILQVHHLGFWKQDRSDRPANLITLCTKCHTTKNHQKNGLLYGWEPRLKSFKPETFMTTVRRRLLSQAREIFDLPVTETFGYLTKSSRIAKELPKSHHYDAFAMGNATKLSRPYTINQTRRNNRSLEKFYDAKYYHKETKEKVSGQELSSGRRTRNKESHLNEPNLRHLRGHKISKGYRAIRRRRYPLQPNDTIRYEGKLCKVTGTHSLGKTVRFKLPCGKTVDKSVNKVKQIASCKGLAFKLD